MDEEQSPCSLGVPAMDEKWDTSWGDSLSSTSLFSGDDGSLVSWESFIACLEAGSDDWRKLNRLLANYDCALFFTVVVLTLRDRAAAKSSAPLLWTEDSILHLLLAAVMMCTRQTSIQPVYMHRLKYFSFFYEETHINKNCFFRKKNCGSNSFFPVPNG